MAKEIINFLIGLIGTYILIGVIFLVFWVFGKYFKNYYNKINKGFSILLFILFNFVGSLLYSITTIVSGNMVLGAFLCSIILIMLWFVSERVYRWIVKDKRLLTKNEKNVCMFLSLLGISLVGIILWRKTGDGSYCSITSAAISILIGAYFPLTDIFEDKEEINITSAILSSFINVKVRVWFTGGIIVLIIVLLMLSDNFEREIHRISKDYGIGAFVGTVILCVGLLVAVILSERKRKIQENKMLDD